MKQAMPEIIIETCLCRQAGTKSMIIIYYMATFLQILNK